MLLYPYILWTSCWICWNDARVSPIGMSEGGNYLQPLRSALRISVRLMDGRNQQEVTTEVAQKRLRTLASLSKQFEVHDEKRSTPALRSNQLHVRQMNWQNSPSITSHLALLLSCWMLLVHTQIPWWSHNWYKANYIYIYMQAISRIDQWPCKQRMDIIWILSSLCSHHRDKVDLGSCASAKHLPNSAVNGQASTCPHSALSKGPLQKTIAMES